MTSVVGNGVADATVVAFRVALVITIMSSLPAVVICAANAAAATAAAAGRTGNSGEYPCGNSR